MFLDSFLELILVLAAVIIGMVVLKEILKRFRAKRVEIKTEPEAGGPSFVVKKEDPSDAISPETAAAIALALNLHFKSLKREFAHAAPVSSNLLGSWTLSGRLDIMNERLKVFNR